jgi:hypothetical protein
LHAVPYVPGGDTPPVRRGPHPLLAFLAFLTLILVAMLLVFGLTSVGRVLEAIV